MSTPFFVIGTVIFLTYAAILFYVVIGQHRKQKENPSNLDFRKADTFDMDGMGDYSRFGPNKNK